MSHEILPHGSLETGVGASLLALGHQVWRTLRLSPRLTLLELTAGRADHVAHEARTAAQAALNTIAVVKTEMEGTDRRLTELREDIDRRFTELKQDMRDQHNEVMRKLNGRG